MHPDNRRMIVRKLRLLYVLVLIAFLNHGLVGTTTER
jgi:hypothetical protein